MMRGRTDRLHAQASIHVESSSVKRTDDYWLRLVGTGLWFLVFGLVTFVLGFVVLPLIRLVTPDRQRRMLRSREELQRIFSGAGADTTQPAVCSCGSGITAAVIALALARLGARRARRAPLGTCGHAGPRCKRCTRPYLRVAR